MPCQVNSLGGRQVLVVMMAMLHLLCTIFFQMLWSKVPGAVAKEDQLFVGTFKLTDNPRITISELGDEGGTIVTITPVTTTDTGTYTCNIADNRINQSLAFTLQVISSLQEDNLSKSEAGRTWLASFVAAQLGLVIIL